MIKSKFHAASSVFVTFQPDGYPFPTADSYGARTLHYNTVSRTIGDTMTTSTNESFQYPGNYSSNMSLPITPHPPGYSNSTNIAANSASLTIGLLALTTQTFNLVVFSRWTNKEPYILLHVFLAYCSLSSGLCALTSAGLRSGPCSGTIALLRTLSTATYNFLYTLCITTLLQISIDRWLSVEFSARYRSIVRRRTIRKALLGVFLVAVALSVPGLASYWHTLKVSCNRPSVPGLYRTYEVTTRGFFIWKLFSGPLEIVLLFLTQARIIIIALAMRLRLLQRRRIISAAVPSSSLTVPRRTVAGIVWGTIRPSMIVLLISAFCNVSAMADLESLIADPGLRLLFRYLPSFQHFYSPFVYLLSFPRYRAIVWRGCFRARMAAVEGLSMERPTAGGGGPADTEPSMATAIAGVKRRDH
ncbi:hypothetical protein BV898_12361 [Hypsibius exemplaris]|uniref:G-protein coupled receptors family 1 profile domain-containing protein n=1 Tax=Hypsibius exemplaris TaxID=2072580 RepID=A0A1W0WDY7_HYPEX|nr:hypothetical protein BV898_12361 [Hypsibius exemplaris]